jgi:hypothetical protein
MKTMMPMIEKKKFIMYPKEVLIIFTPLPPSWNKKKLVFTRKGRIIRNHVSKFYYFNLK